MPQQITILGSTGSIGKSTLQVLALHPEKYQVFALTAHHNVKALAEQCLQFQPRYAVIAQESLLPELQAALKNTAYAGEIFAGKEALAFVAAHEEVDSVMAAIVGAAGLLPTLAAACAGKRVLLANKEALVMSGNLFMQAVRENGATLLPIDSEHNAIFQCLDDSSNLQGVKRVILTASGGPFRKMPLSDLTQVTPAQAIAHPNWKMGAKISVDCATMFNKGLEVIEASHLFGLSADAIDVILHPSSTIHSMVEYIDGSVLAQMGNPDMRTPIAQALAYPERITSGVSSLDLLKCNLEFEALDLQRYPMLSLAYQVLRMGGDASIILNAANEVAVAAFLAEKISFLAITAVVQQTLAQLAGKAQTVTDIETILAIDQQARAVAEQIMRADISSASKL